MFPSAHPPRFTLSIEGFEHDFQVLAFTGREGISQLFQFDLELVSERSTINPESLLHRSAFFEFSESGSGIHGQLCRVMHLSTDANVCRYEVSLRPYLARLEHSIDQRIFQHKTLPTILAETLKAHGIFGDWVHFQLAGDYPVREYCTQYGESTLHFIQRLCEEEGIHFHFQHCRTGHRLVFGDSQGAFPQLEPVTYGPLGNTQARAPRVDRFSLGLEIRTSQTSQRLFDFERPAQVLEQHTSSGHLPALEDYQYPANISAKRMLERHRHDFQRAEGHSDQPLLRGGHYLPLTQHPRTDWNRQWLLTDVCHEGRQPLVPGALTGSAADGHVPPFYRNHFSAIPSEAVFRPPLRHPKPVISGCQTAVVSGPPGEEIHCDRFGRVKVQMHWDRAAHDDGNASLWLRVASGMAGERMGNVALPRVGMEVLVSFLGGDPDQPLVSGCLHHPLHPAPYALPENKTRTVLRTQSTPTAQGSNEVRVEDRKGREQIYLLAQRDWEEVVEHDQRIHVGHQRHRSIKADSTTELVGEEHRRVVGERRTAVQGNDHQTVEQHQHVQISIDLLTEARNEIHLSSGIRVVLAAGAELTLRAGGNTLTLNAEGVAFGARRVAINAGGDPGIGAVAVPGRPGQVLQVLPALTPAQAHALKGSAAFCEECSACQAGACAL